MANLSEKQARFIEFYLEEPNALRAARMAGYSNHSSAGYRVLTNPAVQEALALRRQEITQKTGVTAQKVVAEFAKIAFANIKNFMDENFDIDPSRASLDDFAAVQELSTTVDKKGRKTTRIKLANKQPALDSLAKHLGMFLEQKDKDDGQKVVIMWGGNGRPS